MQWGGASSLSAAEITVTCSGIKEAANGTNTNGQFDAESKVFSWTAGSANTKALFIFEAGTLSKFTKMTFTTSELNGSGSGNQYRILFITGSTTTATLQFTEAVTNHEITISSVLNTPEKIAGITEIRIGGTSDPGSGSSYSVKIDPTDVVLHTEQENLSISSADDWKALHQMISMGLPSTINVQMTADISVTGNYGLGKGNSTTGTDNKQVFSGTFDGQGHTLTFTYESVTEKVYAPFRFVKNATIRNLNVAGTISSNKDIIASVVGFAQGTVSIQNCGSTMSLTSTYSDTATSGGILGLGDTSASITINNCLFAGSLTGYRGVSGIAGYFRTASGQTLSNCLNTGAVSASTYEVVGSRNIYRVSSGSSTMTNCYYENRVGTATDGTQVTTAQLSSGEVAYNLQGSQDTQYWGQSKLNAFGAGTTPILTSDIGNKVVKLTIKHNGDQIYYANAGGELPSPALRNCTAYCSGSSDNGTALIIVPSEDATLSRNFINYVLKVSSAGATTLTLPFNTSNLPSGVKAYTLSESGGAVTASSVDKITANQPVLINASAGTYTFDNSDTTRDYGWTWSEQSSSKDALTGVYESGYVPANCYVLQNGASGLGFYKVTSAETISISPFRAYLTASTGARALKIVYADDDPTGINAVQGEKVAADVYYDLQGRRVAQPTKGLYIVNGKKVILK